MLRKINLNEGKNSCSSAGARTHITSNYLKFTKPRDFRPKCYNHWATKDLGTRGDKVIGVINNRSTFTIKVNFWPKKAIFNPFPSRKTYAKLILLKKGNFYHKIDFL